MDVIDYAFITKIERISDVIGKFIIKAPTATSTRSSSNKNTDECEAIAINSGDFRGFSVGDSVLIVEAPDTRRGVPGKWNDPRSFVIIGRIDGQ